MAPVRFHLEPSGNKAGAIFLALAPPSEYGREVAPRQCFDISESWSGGHSGLTPGDSQRQSGAHSNASGCPTPAMTPLKDRSRTFFDGNSMLDKYGTLPS